LRRHDIFDYIYKWYIEADQNEGYYNDLDMPNDIYFFGAINETTNFNIEIIYNHTAENTNIILSNNYANIEKSFNTGIYKSESTYLEYIYLSSPVITTSEQPTRATAYPNNNINGYDNIKYISKDINNVEQLNYTINLSEYQNPSNSNYYFTNNETIQDSNSKTILTFRIQTPATAYAGEYTPATATTGNIFIIFENNYIRYGLIILAFLTGLIILDIYLDGKIASRKRK